MNNIIVPDVRVAHEVEFFRQKSAYLIRVESDYENRSKRGVITNENDSTETALDNYKNWNMIIENNSTCENLIQKAGEVCVEFQKFIGL